MFSREELLGGLPARRASTLLFAIESRVALLVARDRRAMATYETERTAAQEETAFFAAMAEGRTPPLQPRIQDLDRHAGNWADLLPPDAEGRAALLRRMGEKYGLPREAANVRRILGADDPAVAAAFERQTGTPVSSLEPGRLPFRQRWRWRRARLAARVEDLPPFWLAFALTLTETVGGGILALPIAFAGLGPAAATALLVVFGVVNVVTVAALVEGITRDGNMRYGSAYFGRLVSDTLGRSGRLAMTPALLLLDGVGFVVALVGFGSTLEGATGVPMGSWAVLLFAINAVFLWRGSLDATVATALAIGAVNILLILIISVLALANTMGSAVTSTRPVPTDLASVLGLVFGVALLAYFGHTSAGNAAKVVLTRDPSGRSLLWGNVAAMVVAMALYVFAVLTMTSALPADALVGYDGTVITPLAAEIGPVVNVLGSIFVVLAIGLGSIYLSLSLYNQMSEFAPAIAARPRTGDVRARLPGFALRASPIALIFVAVEILIVLGDISFTTPLALVGTLTLPLLGGIFPMLILAAARRKGERIPGQIIDVMGRPIVVALVAGLFLAGLLAYGLVIWTEPLARIAALAVALGMALVIAITWRRGAFRSRTVVEYRVEPGHPERGTLAVTSAGSPVEVAATLTDRGGSESFQGRTIPIAEPAALLAAAIALPVTGARELKVWAHRVTPEGDSVAVPSEITVTGSAGTQTIALSGGGGQVIIEAAAEITGVVLAPRREG